MARGGHFALFWLGGHLIYGRIIAEEPSLSWVSYLVSRIHENRSSQMKDPNSLPADPMMAELVKMHRRNQLTRRTALAGLGGTAAALGLSLIHI